MLNPHIPNDNGPYAVLPNATMALAHARKLRGMRLGLCLTPARGGDGDWYARPGKSGNLVVLQIEGEPSPSLGLPPLPQTWAVTLPSLSIRQLWFAPPVTGSGELLPMRVKRAGVRVLSRAPLPGVYHETGVQYQWDADSNPWTMERPATLPLAWWKALPTREAVYDFKI